MNLLQELKIDKSVFSVADLSDESDEASYWQTQTPTARLEALELMRQVMYGYDPSTARLERFFEVVELKCSWISFAMTDCSITAYLGLGTNLGDRESNLRTALRELAGLPTIEIDAVSSIYETAAVGLTDQPDFLNLVVSVHTTLSPRDFLDALLHIENKMGRVRTIRWGPRVIDLDLLLYGDSRVEMPGLSVPHPRLQERSFVLMPLAEIAPELTLPGGQVTVKELTEKLLQITGETGNIRQTAVV